MTKANQQRQEGRVHFMWELLALEVLGRIFYASCYTQVQSEIMVIFDIRLRTLGYWCHVRRSADTQPRTHLRPLTLFTMVVSAEEKKAVPGLALRSVWLQVIGAICHGSGRSCPRPGKVKQRVRNETIKIKTANLNKFTCRRHPVQNFDLENPI